MTIREKYTGVSGVEVELEYHDCDDFSVLPLEQCRQVYGVCFCYDEIIIGFGGKKKNWGLIGGTIEKGESVEEAFVREIKEESNMEVLSWKPIGYQKVIDSRDNSFFFQLRVVALVRPYGPFVEDPAGGVTEIKLIDPKKYKEYFNWGAIGERVLERALELQSSL